MTHAIGRGKYGMKPNRNCSVDIFKYVCAVIVVGIHTSIFTEKYDYIAKIAVPFFFAVNGYYYMKRLVNGESICFAYIKKLLVTYAMWTGIYYLFDVAVSIKIMNVP